jgi:hypothetical protein
MKHSLISIAIMSVVVSGCAGGVYSYKPNITVAQQDKDIFDCRVAAAQEVPTNTQIIPGIGSYNAYAGVYVPGTPYSYDSNSGLRAQFYSRCMTSKGYTDYEIPSCQTTALPEGSSGILTGMLRPPVDGACKIPVTENASNLIYPGEPGN